MAHATYIYVAKLASLSGIDTGFLGGDGTPSTSNGIKEGAKKQPLRSLKPGSAQSAGADRMHRPRIPRVEETIARPKHQLNGVTRTSWQETTDRHILGEDSDRNEVQKGGIQQSCLIESNGVAPSRGDHYGRRKTLRTKGQEESREHQP